jgi:intracellular septation protein
MTLLFHDAAFLKWKLTVIYGALAAALLASHVVGDKVLLARLPQDALQLPDGIWRRVNFAWALFFASCAGLNWYIARSFSEETWVSFKVWGMPVLTVAFTLLHLPFLARYLDHEGQSLDGPH